jgi:hypothetical protein
VGNSRVTRPCWTYPLLLGGASKQSRGPSRVTPRLDTIRRVGSRRLERRSQSRGACATRRATALHPGGTDGRGDLSKAHRPFTPQFPSGRFRSRGRRTRPAAVERLRSCKLPLRCVDRRRLADRGNGRTGSGVQICRPPLPLHRQTQIWAPRGIASEMLRRSPNSTGSRMASAAGRPTNDVPCARKEPFDHRRSRIPPPLQAIALLPSSTRIAAGALTG